MPRFHCPTLLATGAELDLPPGAARHVQVLRLQPGDTITLFHGGQAEGDPGGEFDATVLKMGRSDVRVVVGAHHATEREAPRAVHLLAGITANERMDWLVEKATELGVASITPLVAERSVLKLKGERAEKKIAHWQAVAVAACEQCGRNRVPVVHNAVDLAGWVRAQAQATTVQRLLLSLRAGTAPLHTAAGPAGPVVFLSGPEGGLSSTEEDLALQHSFAPVTLGPRVLRAETAPLAALAALTLL
ncbi:MULTISPECIES: 16S rRNA (uracil(1498)-N(3))-methyltransferase [Acidovorax]|jgi:16S rRNA (uracil1498-N3)-methyltransferase|uniref:Ribosomal RNA small subunit methyltransferase E n=1 Tax=Acidovorax facilis TaxID=12917 RepID=A0ABV8DAG4_9BURK|nr:MULTISPECIES: 16S rRNA (uracil(1498)-N(3))-methyltransferase [Acidovorax]ODS61069.1 MAG: 16S rRNA (uracil(1498)-N(3))-methyltransferase [Acidovorax sp. SCN 65-108]OGA63953.1 MAG: 16S rRNA (uracil(1498)-N(3))-methyltransferase [Burkholderiales bacterium RIFCSPHIGHO2_01_FULL_64_960]OJV74087.1 MAG: 16S rRNA (uracil(1498)-N(3))-methyltransferase [Burkholderiales bacterium 64-34]KQB59791.1 16S rRNA methyltransferase [Acidovorax sp. SD340]MCO4245681.1 16S rRNA (uracil(1498)-N(3))-methyltransferas